MDESERPSKSQRKREMHDLQAMGVRLVTVPETALDGIELPERLRDAVRDARAIRSHEGRRRQMQYIGRLMRDIDPAPIQALFDRIDGQSRAEIALHQQSERWRDRLLDDPLAMDEFAGRYPRADLQRVRALIRSVHKEQAAKQAPKNYRELFRLVREVLAAEAGTATVPDAGDLDEAP